MITTKQVEIMIHSLGSKNSGNWHRNHFVAENTHADWKDIQALVTDGYMIKGKAPSFCGPEMFVFHVTDKGKKYLKGLA